MLTNSSKEIINHISELEILDFPKLNITSKEIILFFYNLFKDATYFIENLSIEYTILKDVKKASDFDHIVKSIQEFIIKEKEKYITYISHFNLFGKQINIYLFRNKKEKKDKIIKDIKKILFWLFIATKLTNHQECSKELNIFIYYTPLLKKLPVEEKSSIKRDNVNTGFTMSCVKKSNIVIFRKEEWYKVFIHETLHNLKLDFSKMNNKITTDYILKLFPIKSDVKLYEAYTDTWAKIINVMITSYFMYKGNTFSEYFHLFNYNMYLERYHCLFQAMKILQFMGLSYTNLYSKNKESEELRKNFKEETSVLSYYIINAILLNELDNFLSWCLKYNDNILQFNHTKENQLLFCKLIKDNYRTKEFLNRMDIISRQLIHLKNNYNIFSEYLLQNMRKSLIELD